MTNSVVKMIGAGTSDVSHDRPIDSIIAVGSALSLAALCFAGYVKGSPVADWLPFDATLLATAGSLLFLIVFVLRYGPLPLPSVLPTLALWATFLPTLMFSFPDEVGQTKVIYLYTTTLLCAIMPAVVGASTKGRRAWLIATATAGLTVGIASVLWPDESSLQIYGRITIEGGSTITSSRLVGALVILALVLAVFSRRRPVLALVSGATAGVATAIMLLIGSRGPFVSVLLTLVVIVLTARIRPAAKFACSLVLIGIAVLIIRAATASSAGGPSRILSLIAGDSVDQGRSYLYALAIDQISVHPEGLGWYGFATVARGGIIYPHNLLLEITVEAGWLAGIALLAYAIVAVRNLWRESGDFIGLAMYSLGIYWLIAAQFSSDINGNRATWTALAFGYCQLVTAKARRPRLGPLMHGPGKAKPSSVIPE